MKVIMYSGDKMGGAGRAARRMHLALNRFGTATSRLVVPTDLNATTETIQIENSTPSRILGVLRPGLDRLPLKLSKDTTQTPRSFAWMSALSAKQINSSEADIVHLHWTCAGLLSIEQIGKIEKPVVWTMHDMWAFCGTEHLAEYGPNARWRNGYGPTTRPATLRGMDVDQLAWTRKRKAWQKRMYITTPSTWLSNCVINSSLMSNWDVCTIPNTLDTDVYKCHEKQVARAVFNLPTDKKLILFGAFMGTALPYKGWDLLQETISALGKLKQTVELVVIGQNAPKHPINLGVSIHWMGHLFDDASLALLYSAVDVTVVPSRIESFSQMASEAMACGCPVVAFDTTGLKDVVVHMQTGYLANAFDTEDMARGITTLIEDEDLHNTVSMNSRLRAVDLWSMQSVAPQLELLYKNVLKQSSST
ncbi:glycosyltransferase [Limnobacter sp.]|uniref:glycosyltransferase n=1 Tax=Limnobacter sp. TaxID=2003368 RepID=UPI00391C20AB